MVWHEYSVSSRSSAAGDDDNNDADAAADDNADYDGDRMAMARGRTTTLKVLKTVMLPAMIMLKMMVLGGIAK